MRYIIKYTCTLGSEGVRKTFKIKFTEHDLRTIMMSINNVLDDKTLIKNKCIMFKELELYLNIFFSCFRLFEQRCLTLMDRMSDENIMYAIELMETIVDVWGISSSPLTFAYENDMRDVVAHPCSQSSVIKQWYNGLAPNFCPFLKVKRVLL